MSVPTPEVTINISTNAPGANRRSSTVAVAQETTRRTSTKTNQNADSKYVKDKPKKNKSAAKPKNEKLTIKTLKREMTSRNINKPASTPLQKKNKNKNSQNNQPSPDKGDRKILDESANTENLEIIKRNENTPKELIPNSSKNTVSIDIKNYEPEDSDDDDEVEIEKSFSETARLYIRKSWDPKRPIGDLDNAVIIAQQIKTKPKKGEKPKNGKDLNSKNKNNNSKHEKRKIDKKEKFHVFFYRNGIEVTDWQREITFSDEETFKFKDFFRKTEGSKGLVVRNETNDQLMTEFILLSIDKAKEQESLVVEKTLGIFVFIVTSVLTGLNIGGQIDLWLQIIMGIVGALAVEYSGTAIGKKLYDWGWWDNIKDCFRSICCCGICESCSSNEKDLDLSNALQQVITISSSKDLANSNSAPNVDRTQSNSSNASAAVKEVNSVKSDGQTPLASSAQPTVVLPIDSKANEANAVVLKTIPEEMLPIVKSFQMVLPGQIGDAQTQAQAIVAFSSLAQSLGHGVQAGSNAVNAVNNTTRMALAVGTQPGMFSRISDLTSSSYGSSQSIQRSDVSQRPAGIASSPSSSSSSEVSLEANLSPSSHASNGQSKTVSGAAALSTASKVSPASSPASNAVVRSPVGIPTKGASAAASNKSPQSPAKSATPAPAKVATPAVPAKKATSPAANNNRANAPAPAKSAAPAKTANGRKANK